LGGGSLIYANVLLRKDRTWFVKEDLDQGGSENWPVTRDELEDHYDSVEKMLSAQSFPFGHEPYASTSKTLAFQHAAKAKGLKWLLPPLAVTFGNDAKTPVPGEPIAEKHPNLHGRTRFTCSLCGECNIGCNTGSKNTLDYTYLSHAKRLGADLRARAEVRSFSPRSSGAGYDVGYVVHAPDAEGKKTNTRALPLHRLTCDKLILAAGSFGSTYLLLRNIGAFKEINRQALGSRFSGNGDLLTLAWRSIQSQSEARVPRTIDASHGPVITSSIRVGDALDGDTGRGFYVQDAAYPEFVNWMIQLAVAPHGIPRALKFAANWVALRLGLRGDGDLSAEISELFGDCSPSTNSVPMLGMGRDIPNGQMSLDKNGDLALSWKLDPQREFFKRMRTTMAEMASGMDAEFKDAFSLLLSRVVTVHPLGGCPMSIDPRHGVVDEGGQVHGYPGLYVADGSVMPGPVGANPSLTIAAVADLFAKRMLGQTSQCLR
jgi:cholesterol oxidase